ncbi:MAG: D-arabinono-1,4-lactone oxidase [Thermoanaerobaculia bacterium]|nr:D-arabinono-1,4-lactone oxidase [Thermoanaerobaculia bacterium]
MASLSRREWLAGATAAFAAFLGRPGAAAQAEARETWKNWSGAVSWTPRRVVRPGSVGDVVAAVRAGADAGEVVRVAGTGHSFVPLTATDGSFLLTNALSGVESIDREQRRATVLAGTKLADIHAPIHAAGLGMTTLPDIDRQALAGAIATATHGTGRTIGSLSTQVTAVELVDGRGRVVRTSASKRPDLLQAARVSLGALGVLTRIELQLEPAFRLHEKTWVAPYEEAVATLDEQIESHRHFEFFWVSNRDACLMKTLDPSDDDGDGERSDGELEGERVGWSGEIFPSVRNRRFNEIEFSVPITAGRACLAELRELMLGRHAAVTWPLEYRTVAADDAWLSPAYRRDTVTISAHQAANLPYRPFFDDVESVFRNHDGRPHWGKMHGLRAADLAQLYPRWDDFQRVRRELDPDGRFLSPYLRRILGA